MQMTLTGFVCCHLLPPSPSLSLSLSIHPSLHLSDLYTLCMCICPGENSCGGVNDAGEGTGG